MYLNCWDNLRACLYDIRKKYKQTQKEQYGVHFCLYCVYFVSFKAPSATPKRIKIGRKEDARIDFRRENNDK